MGQNNLWGLPPSTYRAVYTTDCDYHDSGKTYIAQQAECTLQSAKLSLGNDVPCVSTKDGHFYF